MGCSTEQKGHMLKKQYFPSFVILLSIIVSGCMSAEQITIPTETSISISPTIFVATITPTYTPPPPTLTPTSTPLPVTFPSGWISFTNANEYIDDLAFDPNGYLWAASDGGLVKWNTSDGVYEKFTTADGLPDNRIDAVFVAKDGTVWVGSSEGISSFDGNTWEIYKYQEEYGFVSQIFQDSTGKLWFVGRGATTFDGEKWKTYTMADGLGASSVASITEDNKGNIWLGTWFMSCGCEAEPVCTEGVSRFNGQKWEVLGKEIGLKDNDPDTGIKVNAMTVDEKGGIWFGTTLGAIYFDGKTSRTFTVEDGLADNIISDMKIAGDGTIWFATYKGITSYYQDKFYTYPETENLWIRSIDIDAAQSVWLGTSYGIYHLADQQLTSLITDDKLPSTEVTDIDSNQQGAVWLGTRKGAAYTDGTNWQYLTYDDGLPSNEVEIIRIAPDGTLWIGTGMGLAHLVDKTWSVYNEGSFDRELYDLVFDESGGLWVSSYDLHYFDGIKWTAYIGGEDNYFCPSTSEKLAYTPISGLWTSYGCVLINRDTKTWLSYGEGKTIGWDVRGLTTAPDGRVWFASELSDSTYHEETGFKSFDGTTWKLETTLALRDVIDMDFSNDGILWVATLDGAYKYDGDNWTHYTTQDGLAGNYVTTVHVASDGAVWFATKDGLSRFGK